MALRLHLDLEPGQPHTSPSLIFSPVKWGHLIPAPGVPVSVDGIMHVKVLPGADSDRW